jgi:hypothetical protein
MLADGSSASCEYEFETHERGKLSLPPGFFVAHRTTSHPATLELTDGSQKAVTVMMGPRVDEARFIVD